MSHDFLSRRDVLKQSAAVAATCSLPLTLFAKDEPVTEPIPIIDTHQHLWDLTKFKLPWHDTEEGADVLRRSYVTKDYLAATENVNVVQTVYMEVDVAPEQQDAEADYVLDLCQRRD